MSLFINVYSLSGDAGLVDVVQAHETNDKLFCLVDAPDAVLPATTVHRTGQIFAVPEGN